MCLGARADIGVSSDRPREAGLFVLPPCSAGFLTCELPGFLLSPPPSSPEVQDHQEYRLL